MVAHLAPALFGIVGALVVWFVYKDKPGFIRDQASGAVSFQIVVFAVEVVALVLSFFVPLSGIVVVLAWLAGVAFAVLGATTVNKGQSYRYPFGFRIVT